MSNWTHVAAVVRVDDIRAISGGLDFTKAFGKECLYNSPMEEWERYDEHPEEFLPMGSEGSLRMSVWENPDDSRMAAYTVSIFGDLRDHNSAEEIIDWFKKKCDIFNWAIRQAVITVENELNGTKTYTYKEEEDV